MPLRLGGNLIKSLRLPHQTGRKFHEKEPRRIDGLQSHKKRRTTVYIARTFTYSRVAYLYLYLNVNIWENVILIAEATDLMRSTTSAYSRKLNNFAVLRAH